MTRDELFREVQLLDIAIRDHMELRCYSLPQEDKEQLFQYLAFNLPAAKDFFLKDFKNVSLTKERVDLIESSIEVKLPTKAKKPTVRPNTVMGNRIRALRGKLEWTQLKAARFIEAALKEANRPMRITDSDVGRMEKGFNPKEIGLKYISQILSAEINSTVEGIPANTTATKITRDLAGVVSDLMERLDYTVYDLMNAINCSRPETVEMTNTDEIESMLAGNIVEGLDHHSVIEFLKNTARGKSTRL